MEDCDLKAERSSQVHRAVDRDTPCYTLLYQEKKKASVQLLLASSSGKDDKMLSASNSQH